ncbi:MAG: ROK family protein [Bacteroidales bacterium]|nr:ROK family protein [Bacteroidales bacterium]MDE7072915.1 ROK family protein [Bacteroidales bacterium]
MRFGVDIGGTNVRVGLVDRAGNIVDHDVVRCSLYETAADLVLTIAYTILRLAKVNGVKASGIGIGCPNACPLDGTVENATNLKFKQKFSLKELFHQYFPDIPVMVDNDANAAALGEMVYGKGRGLSDYVFVTLGTGVGSGIVSGGKLVYGLNGQAGEIGHMIVEPDGRDCGCGRKGCLERYVAAEGAFQTYVELCKAAGHSPLANDCRGISDLAQAGDAQACQTYEIMGRCLGMALANVACVTAPSHIFVFGGVAQAGELLLEPFRRHFNRNLLYCYRNQIKIELSGLMSNQHNAAILGAAALLG